MREYSLLTYKFHIIGEGSRRAMKCASIYIYLVCSPAGSIEGFTPYDVQSMPFFAVVVATVFISLPLHVSRSGALVLQVLRSSQESYHVHGAFRRANIKEIWYALHSV